MAFRKLNPPNAEQSSLITFENQQGFGEALLGETGGVLLEFTFLGVFIVGGFILANAFISKRAKHGEWWAKSKNGLRALVLIILFVLFGILISFVNNLTGLSLFQ